MNFSRISVTPSRKAGLTLGKPRFWLSRKKAPPNRGTSIAPKPTTIRRGRAVDSIEDPERPPRPLKMLLSPPPPPEDR
ncbi:hypothetical protein TNIN_235751 [Trichonephila inaurata madagascariensis]|uniref:Uncharacterized protein n=1 Tax=Trichonephila inaurata madagascariensis TaxID=2747483 RepID=A0A8X7BN20_9ARAC|nr:hypothetical protein TNIN_235751 [Trichonephila inaurata madagascariensis]